MDEEIPSLEDLIRQRLEEGVLTATLDVDIAEAILEEIIPWSPEKVVAVLLAIITDQVRRIRRQAAREAEQNSGLDDLLNDKDTSEGHGRDDTPGPTALAGVLDNIRDLLGISFKVPVAGQKHADSVTWGEATVPQHRARADSVMRRVRSEVADADRHYAVADLLEEREAACLNDLLDTDE